jgi:hypothetical protein
VEGTLSKELKLEARARAVEVEEEEERLCGFRRAATPSDKSSP